jgi:predicted permease
MTRLRILFHRLLGLFLRRKLERELEEEIRSHLEMQIEENLRQGMSLEEAQRAARLRFGGVEQVKEAYRDKSRLGWIENLGQDLRYGARILMKKPGFTLTAVITLALGIGGNTAIFSLMDAVLLKSLPVERPEQLHFIARAGARDAKGDAPPYPCFERFRDQNKSFAGMAAFSDFNARVTIDGQAEEALGQSVSGNYFSLLGVQPLLGRTLTPADDSIAGEGGPDGLVAVISYNYWTRRFGRNPDVIGKAAQIGARSVTIVGVTPPGFYGLYPGAEMNFSVPMAIAGAEELAEKHSWYFEAVGRLKPGVPVEQARTDLDTIFQPFMDELGLSAEERRDYHARIELPPAGRGLDTLRRKYDRPLQALMGAVALVLLIACTNLANLLLARGTARRKEFAVRLALGASRLRLIRQVFAESLLLATLGALLGLLIASLGREFLVGFFAAGQNRIFLDLTLDGRALLFTAGVALGACLLFGLAPALQSTRVNPGPALKDVGEGRASSRSRFSRLLVVAQVALSLLLLAPAGLFLRTLQNLKNLDPGFQRDGVLTLRINPPDGVYRGERLAHLWKEVLERVERLPGVRSASLAAFTPLEGHNRTVGINIAGFTPKGERDRDIRLNQVSPGFFSTLGIAVMQGRAFTGRDDENSPGVALLNEVAARFYFSGRSPLGAQVSVNNRARHEIIGVVRDSRYQSLREPDSRLIYLPTAQALDHLGSLVLAVRTSGKPSEMVGALRNEMRTVSSDLLLTNIATLDEQVWQSLLQERLLATLALLFGLLALLLACVGLYGVISYEVARRTREIGIRMALGAQARDALKLVVGQGLMLTLAGITSGLAMSVAATRWLESLLYGVSATDPVTFVGITTSLLIAALLACYLPARRATKVDPMITLKYE